MEQQVYCVTTTAKVVKTYEVYADSPEEAERFFQEKSGWLISSAEEEEEIETVEKMIYYQQIGSKTPSFSEAEDGFLET
jgi:hypothetical protein